MKLTEILQKELRAGEKSLGIAQNLLYDNYEKKCLIKTDENVLAVGSVTPQEGYLEVTAEPVDNRPLAQNIDKMQFAYQMDVGQKVFDQNGAALGEISEVELDGKLMLKYLLTSDGSQLKRNELVAVGDAVIAKAKTAKQLVAEELKKTVGDQKKEDAAKPQSEVAKKSQTAQKNEAAPKSEAAPTTATETDSAETTPTRAVTNGEKTMRRKYGDFSFLIGKIVDKTIVNFQGEVMIKQHETITRDVLRQAKVSGKLLELYLHIQ